MNAKGKVNGLKRTVLNAKSARERQKAVADYFKMRRRFDNQRGDDVELVMTCSGMRRQSYCLNDMSNNGLSGTFI